MIRSSAPDRIDYTKPFVENVQGQLKARFQLDSEKEPMFETYPDDPRLRVYTIDVFLESKQAKDIKGVTYYLDDPSYVDPQGYSNDADNQFREEIASYGDVEILVTVEIGSHRYEQRAWLSNMLENGHTDDMTPPIRAALQRIKVN
jgi:hypothetical protein